MNTTEAVNTELPSYYCVECFRGNLPTGQACRRLPVEGFRATCLRCCGHNHG